MDSAAEQPEYSLRIEKELIGEIEALDFEFRRLKVNPFEALHAMVVEENRVAPKKVQVTRVIRDGIQNGTSWNGFISAFDGEECIGGGVEFGPLSFGVQYP